MPIDNTTLLGATDALYATYETIADALRAAGQDPIAIDARKHFMSAMRYLAVHVCDADGQVSAAEATTTSEIFWLDQLGWDECKIRDTLAQHPEYIEQSLGTLQQYARLLREFAGLKPAEGSDHNMVLETATLVFQTVLAADAGSDLEVERLTEITSRLRQAVAPEVIPEPSAAEPVAPSPAADPGNADAETVASILAQLDRLVGLTNIKRQVETLTNLARVFAIRREMGLPVPEMSFHLVFLGNPARARPPSPASWRGSMASLGCSPGGSWSRSTAQAWSPATLARPRPRSTASLPRRLAACCSLMRLTRLRRATTSMAKKPSPHWSSPWRTTALTSS